MRCLFALRLIGVSGPNTKSRLEARAARSIQLGHDVAQKEDLARRQSKVSSNLPVAIGLLLGPAGCVVMALQIRQQIARDRMAEEQFLSLHTAGGIYPHVFA